MPNAGARLDTRAGLIHDALVASGLLATPQQAAEPTQGELDDVAKFLARESRFVRYDGADWAQLLTSESDVETAFAKAKKANEGGDRETTDALSRARRLLLDHIEKRRAAREEA